MSREVWGTFSVRDHLEPHAFVAETMLYDRLVVPVPDNDGERDRWEAQGWEPDRLLELLELLGERAYAVRWNAARRERWRTRFEAGAGFADQVPDWAFAATRTELTAGLPRYITGIEAVTTYRSLDDLQSDIRIARQQPLQGGAATAIIGYEFLIPDLPGASHEELVRAAVALSSEKAARQKRRSYWRWQREFLSDTGITDMASIRAAVEEMADLLEDERAAIRTGGIKTTSKYAFFVGSLLLGFLGGPLAPVGIAGAFLSVGQFMAERLLERKDRQESTPAALLIDAQKRFGWN
jgi:hypothetical protein